MNELVERYGARGLVVLSVPCNQFGHQENGNGQEILNTLQYVRPGGGFVPKFPVSEKVDVNGANECELFSFLKGGSHPADTDIISDPLKILWKPVRRDDIGWNFAKFLVDKTGNVRGRWEPKTPTIDLADEIEKLLAE